MKQPGALSEGTGPVQPSSSSSSTASTTSWRAVVHCWIYVLRQVSSA